CQQCSGSPTF
nr:immunoglobulin light chain junction region [Macaca mulatta]